MKKIILIIFMAIISSFSYYGAVNEKGEKVVNIETTPQAENVITNQRVEETQENVISQVENTVEQAEIIQDEQIEEKNTVEEKQTQPIVENKSKNDKQQTVVPKKQTKQETQVDNQQKIQANNDTMRKDTQQNNDTTRKDTQPNNDTTKKNTEPNTNTNQNKNTDTTNNAPKCTHSSNGWYNSKAEAEAIYNAEIKKWGDKWTNYEIDNDTYYKNCPSGYEVFSCPYCNKWTINLFY